MTGASNGVLVLGLGNLLHSDDGLGVHALQRLQKDPRIDSSIMLLDGGTQGLNLISHISGFPRLLVIDAVDVGEAPGTLVRFEGKALDGLPGKSTVHQLGFADLMIAMRLLDESPEEVVVLGVQPVSTEWGAELTQPVQNALPAVLDAVIAQLESWTHHEALTGPLTGH
jgi:hydrogenase maturation protease